MELAGKVAVVTGGASGIGRALAVRFAQEGAAGVVIGARDLVAAERVVSEIGDRAIAVACDVRDREQVAGLIAAADRFGPVDLFCANAGVGPAARGLAAGSGEWDAALDVNVRAHVVAAELLVPQWLQRGGGYFLSTASAAGLTTQIGSATYAVSKHAAVAFAEWLSVSYGDRGIVVSCLCPMGVDTGMLDAGAKDASGASPSSRIVTGAGSILQPEDVAQAVVEAIRENRFLVLPHPEVLTFFQRKASDYERWLSGMRRLQDSLRDTGPK